MKFQHFTVKSPVGHFHAILENNFVRASGFGSLEDLIKKLDKNLSVKDIEKIKGHEYEKLIKSYFNGDKNALNLIPYKQEGSKFKKKIWDSISKVKYGEIISYKALAILAGNSRAIRAAGSACGDNLICLIVPCHRILKSNGETGNYFYGSKIKNYLLALERA